MDARGLLLRMFEAATEAAAPARCVPAHLPEPPRGRTIIVGAGKAAASMARVVEANWPEQAPLEGLVVTRYGHGAATKRVGVIEAGHPVPDAAGEAAASRIMAMVRGLTEDDLVLCLISGGGSALLAAPVPGVTLDDKRAVNRALLRSGATIHEMNCVRKHLSAVKGGRLALAAAPARIVSLIISDVPGDEPSVIGSGPTAADPTTRDEANVILLEYKIAVPAAVARWLANPSAETPKPGDPRLASVRNIVIATPRASLEAAARVAQAAGVTPLILGDAIEGEARDVALVHAGIARSCAEHGEPALPPCVLLSGGETSVTVRGAGRGGRNAEFLLALGVALDGHPVIHALAADTDGIDGTEDNAGALLDPDFPRRAAAAGFVPRLLLGNNDGYSAFAALDDLVVTGPTLTNVNDFRAILIGSFGC